MIRDSKFLKVMFSFPAVSSGFLLVVVIQALPLAAAPPRSKAAPPPAETPPLIQHKVLRGETLWAISQKHHTSVGAIMDFNHLPDHNVREGMTLRIPPNVVESSPPAPRRQHVHIVKRGEDFWSIADRYDMDPSVLAKANPNVNPNRVHQDMELSIPMKEQSDISTRTKGPPPPPAPRTPANSMTQHTVGEGETFYSIGRKFGVPMEDVVAANPNVKPERLSKGLKVWVPTKNPPPSTNATTAAAAKSKTTESASRGRGRTHTVKENESIATIAKKYDVSESALLRENKLTESDAIYVDDVLTIPTGSGALASAASSKTKPALAPVPSKPVQIPSKSSSTSSVSASRPQAAAKPPSPPPPSGPTANVPANTMSSDGAIRSYIVSAGEDENTICEAFGISKKALFDHNRLAATTKLKPGDEIAIPRVAGSKK
jgi:LysM repeat protein